MSPRNSCSRPAWRGVHPVLGLHARRELAGRVLELLVGEQPGDEDVAGLVRRQVVELVTEVGVFLGQQRRGLDLQKRRRHQQEVARHVEVEVGHPVDVLEVLVGDGRDRDGAHVELLPGHEVQQQVERPLEDVGLDCVGHCGCPASCRPGRSGSADATRRSIPAVSSVRASMPTSSRQVRTTSLVTGRALAAPAASTSSAKPGMAASSARRAWKAAR